MTPTRSVRCDHPLDEWCDTCYMPAWERQLVAMIDMIDDRPARPAVEYVALSETVGRHFPVDGRPRIIGAGYDEAGAYVTTVVDGEVDNWAVNPERVEVVAESFEDLVADVAARYGVTRDDVHVEFVNTLAAVTRAHTPPTEPCRNGRHSHTVRQNSVCDTPTPPPPLVHRAVGATAVVAATGVVVTVAGVWAAAEWIAGPGRVHAAAARQRAHDTWCRMLG